MNWVETFKQMKAGLNLEKTVREEVDRALAKYPFFAMARMMVAKVATKEGDPRAHGLRFLASLYAPSRQYYAFFMGDRVRPNVAPPPRISKQETQPPKQTSSSKEDTPTSSDEPGPANPMPVSNEYSPRLQGKLRAKKHLYKGLSERIQQAIRLPPITPPPISLPQEVFPPSDALPIVSSSDVPFPNTTSAEPLEASQKASLLTDLSQPSVAPTAPTPSPAFTPPESSSSPSSKLSPLLLTLQFELPEKLPTPQALSETISPTQDLPASEQVSENLPSDIPPFQTPNAEATPPSPTAEAMPTTAPLSESVSAFSKTYVPLPNPDAPVSLEVPPEEQQDSPAGLSALPSAPPELIPSHPPQTTETTPTTPPLSEPLSAFSRTYVPLDNPDAPVSPSKSQTWTTQTEPTPTASEPFPHDIFQSESPIRLLAKPEFNPESSIHLPVPEPTQEKPLPIHREPLPTGSEPSITPPSLIPSEETPSAPSRSLSPTWQSFLSEIEKPLVQVAQEALHQAPQAVEKLRQTFIRYLLEARKERRLPQEPPPASTAIEEVLRLLETFQPKAPESTSSPTLMSIPESEAPPSPPTIYTETMARLCWSQGDLPLAMEIYKKLAAKHPEKAAYYETQINRIQRGEQP